MGDEKVRIGFVGVGMMGQCAHLRNYVTVPDCEVVAIAELRPKLGKQVAARYGVPHVYESHEEMLAAEKLDGIVASQQFSRHAVLVPELLRARVPLFTEKPLATYVEGGDKIVQAVKESGTWHMLGYHKRSDPATAYAKAEVERLKQSGAQGEMRYVRIVMPPGDWVQGGFSGLISTDEAVPPSDSEPAPTDMNEEARKEFGEFVNYYIHQLNLMRYLLGEPYEVTYADPSGVVLVVHSKSGVPGVIEMCPYQTSVDWQESVLIGFAHGYVKLDLPAPMAVNRPGRVEILRDAGRDSTPELIVPQLPWVHAMKQQAINFVSAIKGRTKPPCEAEEALEDLRIARDYIRLLRGV